jgi:hypothetical protein
MQLNHESLGAVLAAAQEVLARVSALAAQVDSDGFVELDAYGHDLLLAADQARDRLKQALAECGFGPDLLSRNVSFPSGSEGLIHKVLWEIWQLYYNDQSERNVQVGLERAVQKLEAELKLRGQGSHQLVDLERAVQKLAAGVAIQERNPVHTPTEATNPPRIGPIPPDRFCWQDSEADGLSLPQYRLLEILCLDGRLRDAVAIPLVVDHIYPKPSKRPKDPLRALNELRKRTQRKLDAARILLLIDWTNQSLRLMPID